MIELKGITEIVGECGAGKSILALSIEKDAKTLYISQTQIKFSFIPSSVVLKRIDSFFKLKIFVFCELNSIVKSFGFKKIILDGLEDFLYVFERPRKLSNDIFRIVTSLKKLYFKDQINILIINSHYKDWSIENTTVSNRYFGLPWEYLINYRYLITKAGGKRYIELVCSKANYKSQFYIDNIGAHYLEDNSELT